MKKLKRSIMALTVAICIVSVNVFAVTAPKDIKAKTTATVYSDGGTDPGDPDAW